MNMKMITQPLILVVSVAAALALSAGVMPVTWNHAAPSNTVFQSTASGSISAIADRARS